MYALKYSKYKNKYLKLKQQQHGGTPVQNTDNEILTKCLCAVLNDKETLEKIRIALNNLPKGQVDTLKYFLSKIIDNVDSPDFHEQDINELYKSESFKNFANMQLDNELYGGMRGDNGKKIEIIPLLQSYGVVKKLYKDIAIESYKEILLENLHRDEEGTIERDVRTLKTVLKLYRWSKEFEDILKDNKDDIPSEPLPLPIQEPSNTCFERIKNTVKSTVGVLDTSTMKQMTLAIIAGLLGSEILMSLN